MPNDDLFGSAGPTTSPARPVGRLSLVEPSELTSAQQELRGDLLASRGHRGYAITDDSGRLIGPFNALLRVPAIAAAQLRWAATISRSGIDPAVREAVILVIAGQWRSPYMLYAHRIAGQQAGLAAETVAALISGHSLQDNSDLCVAAELALQVITSHSVTDQTYRRCVERFGVTTLTELMTLIGQYLTTASILSCFDVPAPEPTPTEEGTH